MGEAPPAECWSILQETSWNSIDFELNAETSITHAHAHKHKHTHRHRATIKAHACAKTNGGGLMLLNCPLQAKQTPTPLVKEHVGPRSWDNVPESTVSSKCFSLELWILNCVLNCLNPRNLLGLFGCCLPSIFSSKLPLLNATRVADSPFCSFNYVWSWWGRGEGTNNHIHTQTRVFDFQVVPISNALPTLLESCASCFFLPEFICLDNEYHTSWRNWKMVLLRTWENLDLCCLCL